MPYIKRIKIQNLRNITDVALEFSPSINIFFGNNGSGKTTLLEAIALLGLGKSFRTYKSKNIIQYDCEALTVFGEVNSEFNKPMNLGIQKNKKGQIADLQKRHFQMLVIMSSIIRGVLASVLFVHLVT